MLIIVVLLFGICWCPLQVYHILQVTWESVGHYKYINIVWFCSDWLAMSNSCYNPFIYGIYNVNEMANSSERSMKSFSDYNFRINSNVNSEDDFQYSDERGKTIHLN